MLKDPISRYEQASREDSFRECIDFTHEEDYFSSDDSEGSSSEEEEEEMEEEEEEVIFEAQQSDPLVDKPSSSSTPMLAEVKGTDKQSNSQGTANPAVAGSCPSASRTAAKINFGNPWKDNPKARPIDTRFCFVQYSCLWKLLSSFNCNCGKSVGISEYVNGSCIIFTMRCRDLKCDTFFRWDTSEFCINGGFTSTRALISAFALTGGTFEQFSLFTKVMGCPAPSESAWYPYCKTTLGPFIRYLGEVQERNILDLIIEHMYPIVVAHDVRHDSTRNADHGTATFILENMHHVIVKLVHGHVLEVRNAEGELSQCSTNLDAFLTQLGLQSLFENIGDLIMELTRDGNSSYDTIIKEILKKFKGKEYIRNNKVYKLRTLCLCLDGWHKAKKLFKNFPNEQIKKEDVITQQCLQDKPKAVKNHFYFCLNYIDRKVADYQKGGGVLDDIKKTEFASELHRLFLNCVDHWAGYHDNCIDSKTCAKDDKNKKKLNMNAVCILGNYLRSNFTLEEAKYYLRNRMTSHTESFNRMLLSFAPKHRKFNDSYDWRVILAMIEWNENILNREVSNAAYYLCLIFEIVNSNSLFNCDTTAKRSGPKKINSHE